MKKQKRKIITIEDHEEGLLQCDNKECNYTIVAKTDNPVKEMAPYVNMPCPLCGRNLLTEKDYLDYKNMMRFIDFINKWFGWLTFFNFRNKHKCL